MIVILAPQGLHIGSGGFVGAAMAAASAVTYAMLTVQSKRLMKHAHNDVIIWFEYVVASVVLLPFALYQYSLGNGPSSIGAYVGLVILGVVQTAFAGWIFFAGLKRMRADQAAIFTYGEPVVAVVLAALFMSQRITLPTLLGGALVIAGGTIVARMDTSAGVDISPIEIAGAAKEDD
jgi:drug/metabolite transporter (DMT)-like permease